MITSFHKLTCPECGHVGRPEPKSAKSWSVIELIPIIGDIRTIVRDTDTRLFCSKCGHKFTDSIQDKAKNGFESAKQIASDYFKEH
jgi:DNA-directed RNA polymerase subunit RPC12/RpoP